jgi:hypothetical protein
LSDTADVELDLSDSFFSGLELGAAIVLDFFLPLAGDLEREV